MNIPTKNNQFLNLLDFGGASMDIGLALHGYLGESLDFKSFLAPYNQNYVHWYGLDLLGHGGSSHPEDISLYTENAYIDYLDTVLDVISPNGEKVILLAYSFGARILLKYALIRQERLKGLVIISGTPGISHPVDRQKRQNSDSVVIKKIMTDDIVSFMDYWYNIPLIKTQKDSFIFDEMYSRRLKNTSKTGIAKSLEALGQGVSSSFWDDLHTISLPTIWLTGQSDESYIKIGRMACNILPHAYFNIIPNAGHAPHLENEKSTLTVFNDLITKILSETLSSSGL